MPTSKLQRVPLELLPFYGLNCDELQLLIMTNLQDLLKKHHRSVWYVRPGHLTAISTNGKINFYNTISDVGTESKLILIPVHVYWPNRSYEHSTVVKWAVKDGGTSIIATFYDCLISEGFQTTTFHPKFINAFVKRLRRDLTPGNGKVEITPRVVKMNQDIRYV